MKVARNQRGLTLVELIVAVAIFVLLAVAAATLFVTVLKTSNKDKVTQELQRSADTAVAHMSRTLKPATGTASPSTCNATHTNALTVRISSTQTRRYDLSSSQLRYTDENGTQETLLPPGTTVQALSFYPTCNAESVLVSTKINLTLRRTVGTSTTDLTVSSSVSTRPQ